MKLPDTLRPTILVVDDTPANLTLISNLLKGHYRIKLANHGTKAIELAYAAPPDLILLDIMMPDMDGYEVCRRLKANPLTADIPVIFITARLGEDDELLGLTVGAVDYLTKPIIPGILKARVNTHILLRHTHRELTTKNLLLNEEKELLEEIVTRMNASNPIDHRCIRMLLRPVEKTSGDIVMSAYRPDGAQHVLVGDFSGHGLSAAFAGPLVSYIFYAMTRAGHPLQAILIELNRILYRQLPTQLYMACSALEISVTRSQAEIWNCGLPAVLILNSQNELTRVSSCALPLGISEADECPPHHTTLAATGTLHIYQYSDGITEACSPTLEQYGQERLEALVSRIHREGLPLEAVWQALEEHCAGQPLADDAVILETTLRG